jgi:hypothetical protein
VTTSRDAERAAIQTAMDRLLNGTPTASTGSLSVLQLAAEAGVKRWVLTHKHPDLKAEFERRRTASNGIPAASRTSRPASPISKTPAGGSARTRPS